MRPRVMRPLLLVAVCCLLMQHACGSLMIRYSRKYVDSLPCCGTCPVDELFSYATSFIETRADPPAAPAAQTKPAEQSNIQPTMPGDVWEALIEDDEGPCCKICGTEIGKGFNFRYGPQEHLKPADAPKFMSTDSVAPLAFLEESQAPAPITEAINRLDKVKAMLNNKIDKWDLGTLNTALTDALKTLSNQVDQSKANTINAVDRSRDTITNNVAGVKSVVESGQRTLESGVAEVRKEMGGVQTKVSQVGDSLTNKVSNMNDNMNAQIQSASTVITSTIKDHVTETTKKVTETLHNKLQNTDNEITQRMQQNTDRLRAKIEETLEQLTSRMKQHSEVIRDDMKQRSDRLYEKTDDVYKVAEDLHQLFKAMVEHVDPKVPRVYNDPSLTYQPKCTLRKYYNDKGYRHCCINCLPQGAYPINKNYGQQQAKKTYADWSAPVDPMAPVSTGLSAQDLPDPLSPGSGSAQNHGMFGVSPCQMLMTANGQMSFRTMEGQPCDPNEAQRYPQMPGYSFKSTEPSDQNTESRQPASFLSLGESYSNNYPRPPVFWRPAPVAMQFRGVPTAPHAPAAASVPAAADTCDAQIQQSPQISMIVPESGPIGGGTTIAIQGVNLAPQVQEVPAITVKGVPCSFMSQTRHSSNGVHFDVISCITGDASRIGPGPGCIVLRYPSGPTYRAKQEFTYTLKV